MFENPPITSDDFFSNAAAREAGFSDQFWYHAYTLYMEEVERDSSPSFDKYFIERTVRVPFGQGYIDVLVRSQPEPREEVIMRLTAFPSGDEREVPQLSRVYMREEKRPVLGEASLLDAGWRW